MKIKYLHVVVSVLIFFTVNLSSLQAGFTVCPPACPDCVGVSACCEETGPHQQDRSACSHGGICSDDYQPVDVVPAPGTSPYESVFLHTKSVFQVYTEPAPRAVIVVFRKPPPAKFPALYLRNCSFLI